MTSPETSAPELDPTQQRARRLVHDWLMEAPAPWSLRWEQMREELCDAKGPNFPTTVRTWLDAVCALGLRDACVREVAERDALRDRLDAAEGALATVREEMHEAARLNDEVGLAVDRLAQHFENVEIDRIMASPIEELEAEIRAGGEYPDEVVARMRQRLEAAEAVAEALRAVPPEPRQAASEGESP